MYLKFCNTRSSVRTTHLIKRGCKHRLFKDAVAKVRQIPCSTALEASIKNESHRIPFVITFNPVSSHFQQVISSSRISYRRCKKLRDVLVRAKHCRQSKKPSQNSTLINQPSFQITFLFLPILWTT